MTPTNHKAARQQRKEAQVTMLKLLQSILKSKVISLEASENESNAVLYCNINGKGYRIQITPDETFDGNYGKKTK